MAFTASRKGERRGKGVRFPVFKKKSDARQSFRLRNKKREVRVGEGEARSIRLPKLGVIAVRESTRKLRRMLKNDTNVAASLGQFPALHWPPVAAKQAETQNVCGEVSAGVQAPPERETRLDEAERASAQRPRRAVSAVDETVNTL